MKRINKVGNYCCKAITEFCCRVITRYKLPETDVSQYVQSAAKAMTFVPPTELACLFVQYDALFEEINHIPVVGWGRQREPEISLV